ncbi:MAG: cytochrome c peroxidase [Pirellulaceae bacterium]|nr:cytochrome c peroxidase [Pirellulaceae bacterium]
MVAEAVLLLQRVAIVAILVNWMVSSSVGEDRPRLPVDRMPPHLLVDKMPLGLNKVRHVPEDNALTEARVGLGRRLFFDPVLSGDGSTSCASCHDPARSFTTDDQLAIGVAGAKGLRNTSSLINRLYGKSFFWDGRATSLEEQALKPIGNKIELASSVDEAVLRLQADATYVNRFREAYGGEVTAENLAKALAGFQRTLLSGDSQVDRFQAGDASALTPDERVGLWIFESRGGCWKCHQGQNYTDELYHNTGVSWGKQPLDLGRFRETQREQDRGRFKTPTLRDIARTTPYMHDGSIATLREVVAFYNRGGGKNSFRDALLVPLDLNDKEIDLLVAFLKSLTGSTRWVTSQLPDAIDAK